MWVCKTLLRKHIITSDRSIVMATIKNSFMPFTESMGLRFLNTMGLKMYTIEKLLKDYSSDNFSR